MLPSGSNSVYCLLVKRNKMLWPLIRGYYLCFGFLIFTFAVLAGWLYSSPLRGIIGGMFTDSICSSRRIDSPLAIYICCTF